MQPIPATQPPGEAPPTNGGQASESWYRPPIATAPLSGILFAGDPRPDLEEAATAWGRQLEKLKRPHELLLPLDTSRDEVRVRADALAEQVPALRVLPHVGPPGPGAALRAGLAAARHPLVFCTTCDGQYRSAELQLLLDRIDRVDLVTGCRTGRTNPPWRRALAAGWRGLLRVLIGLGLEPSPCSPSWTPRGRRWLARWVFGVRVHDPECVFRLFRRSIFRRLPIQSDGDFVHVEILAKTNFLGCLMDEVPIAYLPPAAPPAHAPARSYWQEVARLVREADFGPTVLLPEEVAAPAAPPESGE